MDVCSRCYDLFKKLEKTDTLVYNTENQMYAVIDSNHNQKGPCHNCGSWFILTAMDLNDYKQGKLLTCVSCYEQMVITCYDNLTDDFNLLTKLNNMVDDILVAPMGDLEKKVREFVEINCQTIGEKSALILIVKDLSINQLNIMRDELESRAKHFKDAEETLYTTIQNLNK